MYYTYGFSFLFSWGLNGRDFLLHPILSWRGQSSWALLFLLHIDFKETNLSFFFFFQNDLFLSFHIASRGATCCLKEISYISFVPSHSFSPAYQRSQAHNIFGHLMDSIKNLSCYYSDIKLIFFSFRWRGCFLEMYQIKSMVKIG